MNSKCEMTQFGCLQLQDLQKLEKLFLIPYLTPCQPTNRTLLENDKVKLIFLVHCKHKLSFKAGEIKIIQFQFQRVKSSLKTHDMKKAFHQICYKGDEARNYLHSTSCIADVILTFNVRFENYDQPCFTIL